MYQSVHGLHPQILKGWRTTLTRTRAAGTAAAQTGISLQLDTMRAVKSATLQNPTGKAQEESPGKDHTPPSATAKTTETETTTDQTAGTGRTGEEWMFPERRHILLHAPSHDGVPNTNQTTFYLKDKAVVILYCYVIWRKEVLLGLLKLLKKCNCKIPHKFHLKSCEISLSSWPMYFFNNQTGGKMSVKRYFFNSGLIRCLCCTGTKFVRFSPK